MALPARSLAVVLCATAAAFCGGCRTHVRTVGLVPAPVFAPRVAAAPGISVRMHALDHSTVATLFGRNFARGMAVWVVSVTNAAPDAVAVPESAVIGRPEAAAIGFVPYAVMAALIAAGQRESVLARAMTAYQDASQATLVMLAGKIIASSPAILTGVAAASSVSPILFRDLAGYGPQTVQAFGQFSWGAAPLTVAPGAVATAYVFSRNRGPDFGFELTIAAATPQARSAH
jgi:hypothetical protein